MSKLKPLGNRVIVKRVEQEETTASGIIIPDSAKEKPLQAIVVAVGPGSCSDSGKIIALEVKENDKILVPKWAGTEIKIEDVDYLIVKEDEILAIIEN